VADRYSPLKAIGWSIAFVVLTLVLVLLLSFGVALIATGSGPEAFALLENVGPATVLLQALVTLGCAAFFTWLIGVRVLGLGLRDLRYEPAAVGMRGWTIGMLAGALTAGIALAIGVVAGEARWVRDEGGPLDYAGNAALTVLVLAPAALSEEVVFRGVPLVALASAMGRGGAIVAVAIPFALAHLLNPSASALGVGNIALAGIFLGLAFYAPGGIWTAWGAHLGWNGVLACLDTPVSGLPFDIPLLDYAAGGPVWLTGGAFGPEGGIAATIALSFTIVVAARWARPERTAA
jgi:membrane protease YdiL (CAAX protease family)